MDDQERAAFEKWADLSSRQGMRHKDGTYMYARIQDKWEGWQARASTLPAVAMTDDGIIDAADATSKGSNTAPGLPASEMKWLFGLPELREFLQLAAAAPVAAPDEQFPHAGCSSRPACREAGFCMDGETLCNTRR